MFDVAENYNIVSKLSSDWEKLYKLVIGGIKNYVLPSSSIISGGNLLNKYVYTPNRNLVKTDHLMYL
jgi:hypothetical protein